MTGLGCTVAGIGCTVTQDARLHGYGSDASLSTRHWAAGRRLGGGGTVVEKRLGSGKVVCKEHDGLTNRTGGVAVERRCVMLEKLMSCRGDGSSGDGQTNDVSRLTMVWQWSESRIE